MKTKQKKIHGNKYDYSLTAYTNIKTKVKIGCPKHGIFEQTPSSHLNGKECFKCGIDKNKKAQRSTTEEFIRKAKKIHGNKYSYADVSYVNSNIKVKIFCKKCKKHFYQLPSMHASRKNGCPVCAKLLNNKSLRSTTEEFIRKAKKIHGNKYSYEKVVYKNNHTKVKIFCTSCQTYFEQTPNAHLDGHGCWDCAVSKNAKRNRLTTEEFIKRAKKIHGKSFDYTFVVYKNTETKVKIFCPSCKKHFFQSPEGHLQKQGCPYCSISRAEKEVLELISKTFRLKFLKIRPDWLKGLEIDMFSKCYQLGVEYQGEGHFLRYKCKFAFLKKEKILAHQRRDKKKLKTCRKLGMCLIRIPCYSWKKLQSNKEKLNFIKNLIFKELLILERKGHNFRKLRRKCGG